MLHFRFKAVFRCKLNLNCIRSGNLSLERKQKKEYVLYMSKLHFNNRNKVI